MDFSHVRPDHLCHPIETIVEKHRKALQGCCDVLKEEQVKGEKSLEKVTDERKELKKEVEKAKGEISQQKEDIIKAVEDVFQEKIKEVDEVYAVKEKPIVEQQNKVESFLDQVKRAGSLSKNVVEKGSDEEIIESHKMVKERVQMVKRESRGVEDLPKADGFARPNWFVARQVKMEAVSNLFGTGMDLIASFNYFTSIRE